MGVLIVTESEVAACKNCEYWQPKYFYADGPSTGKCFEIMKQTVTHVGSYAMTERDFFCACFKCKDEQQ